VHFLCLQPRETDKNVLKFTKNLGLKFHFLLLGALKPSQHYGVLSVEMLYLLFWYKNLYSVGVFFFQCIL